MAQKDLRVFYMKFQRVRDSLSVVPGSCGVPTMNDWEYKKTGKKTTSDI